MFIILVIVFIAKDNLLAAGLSISPQIGTVSGTKGYYNDQGEVLKVYIMTYDDEPVYCTEPGKSASQSYTYDIINNDSVLASVVGIKNNTNFTLPFPLSSIKINKINFSKEIISYIYNYNMGTNETGEAYKQKYVAKQILIWHYMKLIKESKNPTGLILKKTEINNLAKDANAIFDGAGDYIESVAVDINFNVMQNIFKGEKNINFSYYIPQNNNNNDKQRLIGPYIKIDNPPQEEKKYGTVYTHLLDPDGNYEYTSSRSITLPANVKEPGPITYNNHTYYFSHSTGNGEATNNNSSYSYTVTINGSEIHYFYQRASTKVTVTHIYTNSSNKTTTVSIPQSSIDSVSFNVDLYFYWQSYYVYCEASGITSAVKGDGNYISITCNEGAVVDLKIYYKSKKIVVNRIKVTEAGGALENCNLYDKEVNINTTGTVYTLADNWDGYECMGYYKKPDGTSSRLSDRNISNSDKECKVYTYIAYYEKRDLYKYVVDSKKNKLTNLYENRNTKILDELHSNVAFTLENGASIIGNGFPYNLYSNSNNKKYVFTKDYGFWFGTKNSVVNDTNLTSNNRKNDAENNIKGMYTYSSQIKNRTIRSLSSFHADTSVIYFEYKVEGPVHVYVRHILKNSDGTYNVSNSSQVSFLRNTNEKYYDSVTKKWKTINNGYDQRKFHSNQPKYTNDVTTGFSEYYTIDKNDKLYLDKSRTLLYDGVQYVYKGYYTTSNINDIREIKVNSVGTSTYEYKYHYNSLSQDKATVEIKNKSASQNIYVDFYYYEEDYSNDHPDPTPDPDDPDNPDSTPDPNDPNVKYKNVRKKADAILKFQGQNSSGSGLGADTNDVAYVPASEKIKPYFETASYIPYDLVYKLDTVDEGSGKATYSLNRFNAYQLFDETLVNKKYSGSDSVMLGNNSYSVINTTSGKYSIGGRATVKQVIDNKADYEKINPITKEKNNIKVGDKTNIDSFNGNDQVNSDKYNGLRLGDGTVSYKMTNIVGDSRSHENVTVSTIKNMDVNVYTPMSIDKPTIETTGSYVDHSDIDSDKSVIQKDTEFKLTPNVNKDKKLEYNANLRTLDNYLKGYIVVFDFDVRIKGESGTTNAGTPIWVNKNDSLYATPVGERGSTAVNQLKEKVTTIAVTINEQGLVNSVFGIGSLSTNSKGDITKCKEALTKSGSNVVIGSGDTAKVRTNDPQHDYEKYGRNMNADAFYFVKNTTYTYVLARLYDFKITDCYDVNFKNVFRTFDKANGTVNGLTNICFYSGKNKLIVAGGNNILYARSENTILPLGPYKHTQKDYIKAPKLGYRISFDVKTYGYYDNKTEGLHREVKITPSYYYISKDGTTYNDYIKLYYKNSSGKYVTFNNSYSIAFKPNDGYRNQYNNGDLLDDSTPDDTFLSTKMVNLSVGTSFTLNPDTMMTTSNDKFIQAWYGEFKVPNSTIVVDANNVDLNNPLTDGYLGVIFKIECIDTDKTGGTTTTVKVLYDQDDKAKGDNNHNTSQWDYEGYMGVASGKTFNGSLQLEKGKWNINDTRYQKVKGTVILYDLDDRAANDFD